MIGFITDGHECCSLQTAKPIIISKERRYVIDIVILLQITIMMESYIDDKMRNQTISLKGWNDTSLNYESIPSSCEVLN